MRRLLEQLDKIASTESEDLLTKDDTTQDTLQFWALAFKHRKNLNRGAREFLGYLLPCLSSPVLLKDADALGVLRSFVTLFAGNVRGTTAKEVAGWLDRLESAGFDLGESISEPLPEEVARRLAYMGIGAE